jgi:hypothetical protein
VTITAEQAKAELARRAGAGATPAPAGGITPEQAKAELARREADKDYGPLGLGDNFARMGQTLDDSARIIADSATRGVADKAMGPEQQAATEAARERQGWGGTAVDIGTSVLTSPWKIGSVAAGAGYGAAEGALTEYAHQENWIPGLEDLQRIGTAGITGAGLGGLGAKLGDAFGVNTSRGKDQPYPTDQALQQASEEAKRLAPGGPRAADLEDRVSRLGEVRNAETTGRDAFANLRAGTPEEAAARDAISGAPKPAVTQAAEFVDKYGKAVPPAQTIVLEALLSGGIPYKTAMAYAAKIGLSKIGKAADMPDAKQTEFLASLVRDPRGIGNTGTDQATIDFWRDRLSKLAVGAGKEF